MKMPSVKKGFTLIELLVVIAIISLLSSIVMASLSSAKNKAETTKILQEIKQFQVAMEQYRLANGRYYTTGSWRYTQGRSDDNWAPFVNAMAPYMKIDNLFFTKTNPDVNFHLNYLGEGGNCGGVPMPLDGFTVIFHIYYHPTIRLPQLKTWNWDSNYYCFMNL